MPPKKRKTTTKAKHKLVKRPKRKPVKPKSKPKTVKRKLLKRQKRKPVKRPTKTIKPKSKTKTKSSRYKESGCFDQLEGVQGVTRLENKDGSIFIFLDDAHTLKAQCSKRKCGHVYRIDNYLESLVKHYRSKIPLDIFIEIDYKNSEHDTQDRDTSFIDHVEHKFMTCFQREKTKCQYPFPPFRFHYADVRSGAYQSTLTNEERMNIKDFVFVQEAINAIYYGEEPRELVIDTAINYTHQLLDDPKRALRMFKIDKQLANIKNPVWKKHLIEYIDEVFADFRMNLAKYHVPLRAVDQIEKFVDSFTDFTANFFDFYVIGRILRHTMKHVILFAGSAHTEEIENFFVLQMGFSVVEQSRKSGVSVKLKHEYTINPGRGGTANCVSLQGIRQPWFA